jgi:hypothetical protein
MFQVQFYSKAQALVSHLHQRFKADDSQMFGFRDAGMMTASADSVLPSVLRALGVIQVTQAKMPHSFCPNFLAVSVHR